MNESPESLQCICVQFISQNIDSIFSTVKDLDGDTKYVLKYGSVCLPFCLSESLFASFCEDLDDQHFSIFEGSSTTLRKVYIKDASKLTWRGLRNLKGHKVIELSTIKLCNLTVNDLIGCLSEWTFRNLRLLNISHSTFLNSEKVRVVFALSKLRNLHSLNVSFTEFNSQGLEIITEDLKELEYLNISGTMVSDISPLRKCKNRLKCLSMYNLNVPLTSKFLSVVSDLDMLRHLDISVDKDDPINVKSENAHVLSDLLDTLIYLRDLVSLDLSGRKRVDIDKLKSFLRCHKSLKFLGLMDCDACQDNIFCRISDPMFNPILKVTGYATEAQILASLETYLERKLYLQKSLCYLYSDIQYLSVVRLDIVKLVLQVMNAHSEVLAIQMAATACLYSLTKGTSRSKLHVHWLRIIIESTLTCMRNFPKKQQLLKNSLLILCNERMLEDVNFDKYHCARLVRDSLLTFDDPAMNRMAVAISSVLVSRISTIENTFLGAKEGYIQRLLDIVREKSGETGVDMTLKFTLSALWNLTDESPIVCEVFLDSGGLQLFLDVLNKFPGESSVESKILGLLNNIAEVSSLRQRLLENDFIKVLRLLLRSDRIDVSYFAAGIIAHLTSAGESFWNCTIIQWHEIILELGSAVLKWEIPSIEMVAYRSFSPFYPLFSCFDAYQVQLWAAWAIHHVCLKNPKRYCKMMVEEDGVCILQSLVENGNVHFVVEHFCTEILQFVKEEFPKALAFT